MLESYLNRSAKPNDFFAKSENVSNTKRYVGLSQGLDGKNYYTKHNLSGYQSGAFFDRRACFLRELYFGELYQVLLGGEKAPSISVIYDQNKFIPTGGEAEPQLKRMSGDDSLDIFDGIAICSQELKGFTPLKKLDAYNYNNLEDAASLILAMTFLGEKDWNTYNIMFDADGNLGKVDHEWSGGVIYSDLTNMMSFMLRQALKYHFMFTNLSFEEFEKSLNHLTDSITQNNLAGYTSSFLDALRGLGVDVKKSQKVAIKDYFYIPSCSDGKNTKKVNSFDTVEDFLKNVEVNILRNHKWLSLLKFHFKKMKEEMAAVNFKVVDNNWLVLLWFKISDQKIYKEILEHNLGYGALTLAELTQAIPFKHGLLQVPAIKPLSRQTCYAPQKLFCLAQTARYLCREYKNRELEKKDEERIQNLILSTASPLEFGIRPQDYGNLNKDRIENFAREMLRASQELTVIERLSMLRSIELCFDSRIINIYSTVGKAVFECGQNKNFSQFELGYLAATYAFKQFVPDADIPLFKMVQGSNWLKGYFFNVDSQNVSNEISFGNSK